MNKNLSLEQNLCSARVFLNVFGLKLDDSEEFNEFSNVNILNSNDEVVGFLSLENGSVKMHANMDLGSLEADYKMTNFFGFIDLECGGAFKQWNHTINFKVDGDFKFSGDLQIGSSMDTVYGNSCRAHAKINYKDFSGNNVVIRFMDNGYPFAYSSSGYCFGEQLWVDPWSKHNSYIYHYIRKGVIPSSHLWFPEEVLKFVWDYNEDGRSQLRTFSSVVENLENKEWSNQLYEKAGEDNSNELAIQKGLLMQEIDSSFSEKMTELRNLFKNGDMSIFSNLIALTFYNVDSEVKKALFGIEIGKIAFQNGTDNLFDAYFDVKGKNPFSVEEGKRIVKK